MATVRINRYAAESGQMPRKCICCGADATQNVRHTFYYQPAWMVLFYILLPRWVKWALSSEPVTASVPVCMSHATRLKWPTYVGYLFLAGVVLLVPAMIFATYSENDSLIGVFGLLLFLFAVGIWILYVAVALLTPRAVQYTSSTITFGAVSQEFAQAAGTTASTSTRVPSAGIPAHLMPGYQAKQGTSGAKLAMYIIGGGMAVVLLGCCGLPVLGALVRAARPGFPRQVAQQPQPPNFDLPPTPTFTPPPPVFVPPPTWAPPPTTIPTNTVPAPGSPPSADAANVAAPPVPTPPAPTPPPRNQAAPLVSVPDDYANSASAGNAGSDPAAVPWNTNGQVVVSPLERGLATIVPAGSVQVTEGTHLRVGAKVWYLTLDEWRSGTVVDLRGPSMAMTQDAQLVARRQPVSRRSLRLAMEEAPAGTSPANVASDPMPSDVGSATADTADNQPDVGGALTESTPRVEADLQRGEPTHFPEGSTALKSSTKLKRGDTVWTLWGSTWYPSSVVQSQSGGPVKIHYFGYSDGFDEILPRERLRLPAGAANVAKKPTKSPQVAASPTTSTPTTPAPSETEEPPAAAPPKPAVMRTWTDTTGKFKIEAKLLEVVNGKARLEKADGKVISLPLNKLSSADREIAEGGGE